jgi:L-asparaginase
LGAYETSVALKNAGAVCGFDMTTEAAVSKLYYLFSCGYDVQTVKQKMEEDIAGEITRV